MPTLAIDLRNKLEKVVVEARDVAEIGARAALEVLAVHDHEPYPHMKAEERKLRNHLRARARQLGDRQDASGRLAIHHLMSECAYEHWHRMLFARFLAENNLLIEPDDHMAISLAEAEELAKEESVDVWVYASRCAQRMLPHIFRPDDPLLLISFATEHLLKLEKLLASLPSEIFAASDALGWVYQFWQSKKKDEVNRSEVKIGADEISTVTQLFTEPYMVEFLLHNTLGAWWAGKRLTSHDLETANSEDDLRKKLVLPGVTWDYLRFVRGDDGQGSPWRPAAGTFDGWPRTAKDIKVLDPCCGSGHFLVAALHELVPIRMAEEGLPASKAVDAVLHDNLHGLEIDERCCQIAAFALALASWTYPEAGGYRPLSELHIACTGIGPQCSAEQWIKLVEHSVIPLTPSRQETIKNGLLNLHHLFSQAPTLGSLINPAKLPANLITADYKTIQPYLTGLLSAEKADDETLERAIAAAGMLRAADLLASNYTLVITNVPYLARGKQCERLKDYIEQSHYDAKQDLATAFLSRAVEFCAKFGGVAMVTPQNWLFLVTYKAFRMRLLKSTTWNTVAKLGEHGFESSQAAGAFTTLINLTASHPNNENRLCGLDVSDRTIPFEKAEGLRKDDVRLVLQKDQLLGPDSRITLTSTSIHPLLERFASAFQGISPADYPHYGRCFWETDLSAEWEFWQSTVDTTIPYGGRELVLWCNRDLEQAIADGKAYIRGHEGWGRRGVVIRQMRELPCALYTGEKFDTNCAAIVPRDERQLSAIWCYCSSDQFNVEVRKLDNKVNVTNATLVKVPFDLDYWQKVAGKKYPDGLPEPESDYPTQWLFHGRPNEAQENTTLQVAVARLLGYRWPAELDEKMRLSRRARVVVAKCVELAKYADNDGIVCIPAVRGEEPAAERLLGLLAACGIEPEDSLDDWLRDGFFEQHCKLFLDRPFIWHIWDGRKHDGFHALVNYHKLSEGNGKGRKLLESLTYSYLGDWIARQKDGVKRGEGGAEDRLAAVVELQKRLEAILAGEPPFDIFVRWKSLPQQSIGWNPDINDGVRLNIRPFLASDLPNGRTGAGIFRSKPNIKWVKDRGKEPHRPKEEYPWFWGWDEQTMDFMGGKTFDGNRWNDCHYSNGVKQAARTGSIRK